MTSLSVSIGQHSTAGPKPENQDFHGALVPKGIALARRGVTVAIADGISSSAVGRIAAESAVKAMMTDYYDTPDSWTVKTAASKVIAATNGWLYAQSRRLVGSDRDRGYVATLSTLILRNRTAYILHVGDSRIARLTGKTLEPLTEPHRLVLSSTETYLARAMGAAQDVEIAYREVPLGVGDVFVLTTDGVHEAVTDAQIARLIDLSPDLDCAAQAIADFALSAGANDNCTVQIVRIDTLPDENTQDLFDTDLPPAPILTPPCTFDGFRIERTLQTSARSSIYLAVAEDGSRYTLKVPSAETREQPDHLRRMLIEEWVARRASSPHLMSAGPNRERTAIYAMAEYIEGQTLREWMHANPAPALGTVRDIVGQIAVGLRALHRREIIHQDLRPENIMIDANGTVKIIDFGAAHIAGVDDTPPEAMMLGTLQYSAPEYFRGLTASALSDQFSLGVIAYEMLTGRLPYGAAVAQTGGKKLRYASAHERRETVPLWVDGALARATHPDPAQRYPALSEFIADLSRPGERFDPARKRPLLERNPLAFWQGLSLVLAIALVAALIQ